jgi:hypothetical protein
VTLRRALDGLPVQEKLSFCPGVVAPLQLTQMYPSDSCRADLLPLLPSSDWNCAEGLFVISNSRGRSENTSVYVFLHDFSSSRLLQACPSLLPSHAPTTVLPQRSKTCQNPRVCVPRSLLRLPSLSFPPAQRWALFSFLLVYQPCAAIGSPRGRRAPAGESRSAPRSGGGATRRRSFVGAAAWPVSVRNHHLGEFPRDPLDFA